MKLFNSAILFLIILFFFNCSSNDSNSDKNTVFGTIQLSGPDTSSIGTTLEVGIINIDGLDTTGTTNSVTLSDKNTIIVDSDIDTTNFSNAFIIVASEFTLDDNTNAQKAISMTIISNGVEYRYSCLTPSNNSEFVDCGTGLKVDKTKKEVVFKNTTVINTDSGNILTINGIITWQ